MKNNNPKQRTFSCIRTKHAVMWGVNSTWAQEMIGCVVSGHASTCAIEENYDDSSTSLPKIAEKI